MMKLILNDEFLNQYKIEDKSNYNDNYYRLPFNVDIDNHRFNILHITFDETSDENDYALWKARQNSKNIIVLKGGEK